MRDADEQQQYNTNDRLISKIVEKDRTPLSVPPPAPTNNRSPSHSHSVAEVAEERRRRNGEERRFELRRWIGSDRGCLFCCSSLFQITLPAETKDDRQVVVSETG